MIGTYGSGLVHTPAMTTCPWRAATRRRTRRSCPGGRRTRSRRRSGLRAARPRGRRCGSRRTPRPPRAAPPTGRTPRARRAPTARGPRDHRQPDRAGADDQHLVAGRMCARSTACSPTASGSTSAPSVGIERLGEADRLALVHPHVLGERARAAAHADHVGLLAVRGLAGEARQAAAAADERERGDVAALAPAPDRCRRRRRRPRRRTRGPSPGPPGIDGPQLQVGAADAARGHLQHELAGPG